MTTAKDNNVIDPNLVNCPECLKEGKEVTLFSDGACPECSYLDFEMNAAFIKEMEEMDEMEEDEWEDDDFEDGINHV